MDETEAPATGEASGDRVAVILPDGRRGTVPRSSLAELPQGTQLETPEATETRKGEQAQASRGAQTFIESFADTATFGGTSALARAIAPGEAQKMRQRREQNQAAAIVGTIAGGLTPGGVGGIIGKGGKYAAEAVAGTNAVRALATGGKAAKAVARYAPAMAQGAAEGALFGVGTGISNVALSKDPISAESAMAEISSSAILGLGIGTAAGLGGQFLSDSATLARAHVKRMTTPTIADDVLSLPSVADVGGDTLRIAKGPGRARSGALRSEQRALESEAKSLVGRFDGPKPGTPADVPAGFVPPAGEEAIVHGLPKFADADAPMLYVVTARDLDEAGLHALAGGGEDAARMNRVRGQFAEGKPVFDPLDVSMAPDGQLVVSDGRHRILAALEAGGDQPLLIRVSKAADGALEGTVPLGSRASGTPASVIADFKAKYHKMDTASRQNIRQMEGLERKGVEISAELRQAADDLERARRATREWLPLEKERSYDVVDAGPRGGYADKQGKSLQSWTGTDSDIAEAVRKEGFRDVLLAHQEALDHMQALLGNRAYPHVIEQAHGVFNAPKIYAPAPRVPDAELLARMEDVAKRWDALESAIAKQSAPERVAAFVKMAEGKGMAVGDDALNAAIKDAGLDGLGVADIPKAELDRLKAEIFQRQAKEQVALAKAEQKAAMDRVKAKKKSPEEKKGGALSKLLGESLAEKAATGLGAAVGGALGGPYGAMAGAWAGKSFLGGPLSKITGQVSGKVSGRVQKLADGVDAFLGATAKAAPKTVKLTNGILKAASFAMAEPSELPKGQEIKRTAFDQRAAEMGKVMADPMASRQAIHDSLAGVRLADPLLADQMEDLAFRRLLFLADKMPKNPGLGSLIGKPSRYEPSDTEQAKWARYIDAAENPGDIVDSLTDGTLSAEAVEVMQELYPATYERIQADIVTRAGELQTELSWDQRLTLSTLFKKPTDSVLRPSSILSLQATYMPAEGEEQQPPSGGAMKAPSVTPGQKAAGA